MARVRGVFFTFGGFFLVMLVLILSLLVSSTLNQSNTRLAESGSLERVFVLSDSLDTTLAKINNGINYSLEWDSDQNKTILTIKETLDEDYNDYGNSFFNEVQSLINFVEGDDSAISFDYTKLNDFSHNYNEVYNVSNKIPVLVKPNGILYTHEDISGSNVLLIHPQTAIPEINFLIELESENLDGNGIQWTTQNTGSNFTINITVEDGVGGSDSITQTLDETRTNTFTINDDLTITIGEVCDSCIQVDRGDINITSTISMPLLFLGEQTTIHYPKGTYTITFEEIGIFLNNTPRIL